MTIYDVVKNLTGELSTLEEIKEIRDGFKARGIESCAVVVKYHNSEPTEYAIVAGRR